MSERSCDGRRAEATVAIGRKLAQAHQRIVWLRDEAWLWDSAAGAALAETVARSMRKVERRADELWAEFESTTPEGAQS